MPGQQSAYYRIELMAVLGRLLVPVLLLEVHGSTVPIPARQIAQAIVSNYINVQFKTAEQFAQVNHTQVICIKLLLLWLQAITLISDSKVYSVSRYGVY